LVIEIEQVKEREVKIRISGKIGFNWGNMTMPLRSAKREIYSDNDLI
jgi:hypothetical protein